jgi:hypothetical protein
MAKVEEPDTESDNHRTRRNIDNIDYLDDDSYFALLLETVYNPDNQCTFLVDSGASRHICNDVRMFTDIYDCSTRKIVFGNGQSILCSKSGHVTLNCGGPEGPGVKLMNVLFVPTFGAKVISLSVLDKYDLQACFKNGYVHIGCEDTLNVFLIGEKNAQGLYEIRCHGERNVDPMFHPRNCASYALTAEISTREGKQLWHERMGHANDEVISQLSKQQDRTGVNLSSMPDTVACGECVQAKLPASSMTKPLVPPDTKVGELVFSDICG